MSIPFNLTLLLAVYDATDSDQMVMRFEYAGGRLPVAVEMLNGEAFDRYYLHYDQVGSLRVVTDDEGDIVKTVEYDSFGNVTDDTAPSFELPLGFAGGFYDADTGLLLFGYRDYDPTIGRWLARDPISFAGGDTNLWVYCGNDPVNRIDPNGLESDQTWSESASDIWNTVTDYFDSAVDYVTGGALDGEDAVDVVDHWVPLHEIISTPRDAFDANKKFEDGDAGAGISFLGKIFGPFGAYLSTVGDSITEFDEIMKKPTYDENGCEMYPSNVYRRDQMVNDFDFLTGTMNEGEE